MQRWTGLCVVVVLAGCNPNTSGGPQFESAAPQAADAAGVASPAGAFLAYEHQVQLQLPAEAIAPRIQTVVEACQQSRFGDCAVLEVSQQAGETPSGSVQVRIAPAGVEPLIALAGDNGMMTTRTTQAEDLAQQVADTRLAQARLGNEHKRLLELQQRRDIEVEELLAISARMAEIEAALESANRDAAQQTRRIDTQRITLSFQSPSARRGRGEIGSALAESGAIFTTSLAYLVRIAAGVLPFALVGGVIGWLGARWWRRRRRVTGR